MDNRRAQEKGNDKSMTEYLIADVTVNPLKRKQ